MAYKVHCDICDRVIEEKLFPPKYWFLGETEKTNNSNYPPVMEFCSDCFPIFEEEIKSFLKRVKELQELGRRNRERAAPR